MEIRNNVQSPNFGMAFKINNVKGMPKALEKLPEKAIASLQEAGKILGKEGDEKATKYYHVVVDLDNSGNPIVRLEADRDAYFGIFRHSMEDGSTYVGTPGVNENIIMLSKDYGEYVGPYMAGVARYMSDGEVKPRFNAWIYSSLSCPEDASDLAEIAKILDSVAAQKAYGKSQVATQEAAKAEKISTDVANLMKDYSIQK